MISQAIGFVAAVLTTCAFMPQAIKVLKTRNTENLSFWMLLMQGIGNSFWCVYGYMIGSDAILYANVITSSLVFFILVHKVRHLLQQ